MEGLPTFTSDRALKDLGEVMGSAFNGAIVPVLQDMQQKSSCVGTYIGEISYMVVQVDCCLLIGSKT